MRWTKLFLISVVIIIGFAAADSARAGVCPTASPQGVGCASEPSQTYYCSGSCRSMDIAYCPENSLTPVAPCTGLDACGVCDTCATDYLLCTASAYPTRSCTYNDPADNCATLVNSNCNSGECASCDPGYTLCATDNTCIATQSCEPWETFNACTNTCEGAAPTLKLNYNSVNASNYIIQSSSPVISIPPSGDVGIGTTAPGYLFDVDGLGNFSDWAYGSTPMDTDDYALTTVEYVNSALTLAGGGLWGGATTGNIWSLNSGNVGIGTTNPTTPLQITDATASLKLNSYRLDFTRSSANYIGASVAGGYFLFQTNAGNNVLRLGTAGGLSLGATYSGSNAGAGNMIIEGNVGIGTTAPASRLTILPTAGNSPVLKFLEPDGTAEGVEFRTGPSGSRSHYIGFNAGANHTDGSVNNTAFGYQAMDAVLDAASNNVALGTYALSALTSGDRNAALGANSLVSLTSGIDNLAQGFGSLYYLTTQSYNVAFGAYSGYLLNGTGNVIVGSNAMGRTSGGVSTATNYNTVMGYFAGNAITEADGNILLGYQAGNALTTGGRNILIGYDIDTPAVDTSNYLSIGNLIFGTGVDGVGATPSSGKVGIGTTGPGYLLDVNGLGYFNDWVYGSTPMDTDDYALTTVEYVNSVLATSGLWGGATTGNIWSLNSGNVGIGTTAPSAKLEVAGTGKFTNALTIDRGLDTNVTNLNILAGVSHTSVFQYNTDYPNSNVVLDARNNWNLTFQTNDNEKMRITSNGKVGIGTTGPVSKLSISDATTPTLAIYNAADNNFEGGRIRFLETSATTFLGGFIHYDGSANLLNIGTHTVADQLVSSDINTISLPRGTGKVGIGTTAPDSLLHVQGLSYFNDYATGLTPPGTNPNHLATVEYVDAAIAVGSGALATFVGVTASTYNGDQSSNPGYAYADTQCSSGAGALSGSHVCTVEEILYSVRSGVSMPSNTIFWIFSGPPGYTASANDCEGRTTASSPSLGAVWDTNVSYPQGRGMLTLCNNSNVFGCCK